MSKLTPESDIIFARIKSDILQLCSDKQNIPNFEINIETNELVITKYTERTYQCIMITYNEKNEKLIRTYYEEFINEIGHETIKSESHYEMSYQQMIKDICSLFMLLW